MALTSITETTNRLVFRAGSNAPVSGLSRIRGETPGLIYTAVGHAAPVVWSDGGKGGSFQLSGANNSIAAYTPRNKSQAITITATDGTLVSRALQVWATMPVHPQVGAELDTDIETKVKTDRLGGEYLREDGGVILAWVYAWDNREDDEKDELRTFWLDHRKIVKFYMVDVEGNIMNKVRFNSSMKVAFNGAQRWALSAAFKGLNENTPAP